MLRTNSRKVREKVRDYIAKNTTGWEADPKTFEEAADIIAMEWRRYVYPAMRRDGRSIQEHFADFAAGLPNSLFDYYAYGDTVKTVGDMLEQTESERSRYTDSQACDLLTYLIFREIGNLIDLVY